MHFATLLIYLQIHLYDFIEYYFIFMMTEAIEKMMQRLDEKLDEFRKELKEGQDILDPIGCLLLNPQKHL